MIETVMGNNGCADGPEHPAKERGQAGATREWDRVRLLDASAATKRSPNRVGVQSLRNRIGGQVSVI